MTKIILTARSAAKGVDLNARVSEIRATRESNGNLGQASVRK